MTLICRMTIVWYDKCPETAIDWQQVEQTKQYKHSTFHSNKFFDPPPWMTLTRPMTIVWYDKCPDAAKGWQQVEQTKQYKHFILTSSYMSLPLG